MAIHELDKDFIWFPGPEELIESEGIVAFGGDLRPERLLLAFHRGIFPWNGPTTEPIWWSPPQRMVLAPREVYISKSSRNHLNQKRFHITFNRDFEAVIRGCMEVKRKNQDGTWITEEHVESFTELHRQGHAHSVEAWQNGELVGGLYGVVVGSCFCGESMFSKVSNAGKISFISLCKRLERWGFKMIDCQVYNPYLSSLGAYVIPRKGFLRTLEKCLHDTPDLNEVFANDED